MGCHKIRDPRAIYPKRSQSKSEQTERKSFWQTVISEIEDTGVDIEMIDRWL
jgi:hypothetical protein